MANSRASSRQRGRIFRQLLRLLPARGLCAALRHLYREGIRSTRRSTGCATRPPALLERDDVIIVASVSCIYGIGSVETYSAMIFDLKKGRPSTSANDPQAGRQQYKRNDAAFQRGTFRVRGDNLEIWPAHYEDMRLAHFLLRRRDRGDFRIRSADRQDREAEPSASMPIQPLRHPRPDDEAGDGGHQGSSWPNG
jgi:transcription-repair coupling factor (superfamily II helicase)